MNEETRNTLRRWGAKLKKDINKMNGPSTSLDQLEKLIADKNIDGTIAELQRLKGVRKKLRKKG